MRRQTQPTPHTELAAFDVRLIVAGSRGFNNYRLFSQVMFAHEAKFAGKSIVYISGCARSGADDMIIRWCKENNRPWAEFPADWDDITSPEACVRTNRSGKLYNVLAGFQRNAQMAEAGTDLITFHDGLSKGTKHMTDLVVSKYGQEHASTVLVDLNEQGTG